MTIPATSDNNFPKARFGPSYLSVTMKKIFKWPVFGIHCERLQGDASERSYFRVSQKNTEGVNRNKAQKSIQSLIVMQLEKPILDVEIDFLFIKEPWLFLLPQITTFLKPVSDLYIFP